MPKLTDTQLVILSAAAGRDNGTALPLPKSLRITGAAVTRTLDGLRKKGLLEEKPAPREAVAWRDAKDGRPMTLVVTDAGLKAIDGEPASKSRKASTSARTPSKLPRAKQKTASPKPKTQKAAPAGQQGTKQALLIDLLKRKTGATIYEIVEATGRQAHSVRGAISGTLKTKLGLTVSSEKIEGRGRVYRITDRT